MCFEKRRQRVGTLDVTAELDELPAFAVAHGRIGDAVKQICAFEHGQEEVVRLQDPLFSGAALDHVKIQTIELFPHARAALLANMAKVFTRCGNAGNDGRTVGAAEDQGIEKLRRIDRTFHSGSAQRFQQKSPAAGAEFRRLIEPELQFHVDEPRGVLGSLEITAHPVQAVGDTRKHARIAFESLRIEIARRTHGQAVRSDLLKR